MLLGKESEKKVAFWIENKLRHLILSVRQSLPAWYVQYIRKIKNVNLL